MSFRLSLWFDTFKRQPIAARSYARGDPKIQWQHRKEANNMSRIFIAFRAFFSVLVSGEVARRVAEALADRSPAGPGKGPETPRVDTKKPSKPRPPSRSDAITLLATLQREARLVDFLQESLADYSDAQIGAAVRDVHRDCASVLERLFALKPVMEEDEGAEVEVPAGFDSGRYRLTGNVAGEPPFRGRLAHHGWQATKSDLPAWSGSQQAARIVAPAEVDLP
jgi:hypothetical protein